MTMTIKAKLYCLTSLTLGMMLVLALMSYRGMNDAGHGLTRVLQSSDVLRNHLEADMMHDALRADVLAALLAGDDSERDEAEASAREHIGHFRQLIRDNQIKSSTFEVRKALDEVGPVLEQYIVSGESVIRAARISRDAADRLLPEFLFAFGELEGRMSAVSDVIEAGAATDQAEALAIIGFAKTAGYVTFALALIASMGAATWIIHSITVRLGKAAQTADAIAAGELGHRIDAGTGDEIGVLLSSLQRMDATLVTTVESVRHDAHAVAFASRELVKGSDDLNERTQRQAAALEETAASMEEMTATVKQNADNAREASGLVDEACVSAEKGSRVMASAVAAMQEINESSRQIANIIGVIDEIAFQTNLLALNAAVEAARAGEQGRGFAVVASEVRNLAQRSAHAAREIKTLITDSTEKVRAGTQHVDASGQTLKEIVGNVERVTQFVAAIAAASREQAAGIDQVNLAVTQMDSTTQQNAALVEESTAASKAMEAQAASLLKQMSFFQLRHATARVPGAMPKARRGAVEVRWEADESTRTPYRGDTDDAPGAQAA